PDHLAGLGQDRGKCSLGVRLPRSRRLTWRRCGFREIIGLVVPVLVPAEREGTEDLRVVVGRQRRRVRVRVVGLRPRGAVREGEQRIERVVPLIWLFAKRPIVEEVFGRTIGNAWGRECHRSSRLSPYGRGLCAREIVPPAQETLRGAQCPRSPCLAYRPSRQ